MKNRKEQNKKEKVVAEIAKKHLLIDTLEIRKRDHLDFSEQSVWGIKTALLEAFDAGLASAKQ